MVNPIATGVTFDIIMCTKCSNTFTVARELQSGNLVLKAVNFQDNLIRFIFLHIYSSNK